MPGQARDGRSTRWEPHRRERRLAIIKAAAATIERQGPDVLTGQIADEAGVPRTHVYRHFEGKQALDHAVARHIAAELGEQVRAGLSPTSTPRSVVHTAIGRHLSWLDEHPNLYRFLAQHAHAGAQPPDATELAAVGEPAIDDAKAVLAAELRALLGDYLRAAGIDTAAAERAVVGAAGMVDATAAWWLEHRDVTRADLAVALTDQVLLILDQTARGAGVTLDPDAALPTPQPMA